MEHSHSSIYVCLVLVAIGGSLVAYSQIIAVRCMKMLRERIVELEKENKS